MLITKDDAQKMNLILAYLDENETARFKLKQIMDLLQINLESARYLYESILKYHHEIEPVISIHHAENIANRPGLTSAFLKKGGFLAVYEKQAEIKVWQKTDEIKQKSNSRLFLWQQKTYWITFGLALAGFILAILSILFSLKIIQIH